MPTLDHTLQEYLSSTSDLKRMEAGIYMCGREGRWPSRWGTLMEAGLDIEKSVADFERCVGLFCQAQFPPLNKVAGENMEASLIRQIDLWRAGREGKTPSGWPGPQTFKVILQNAGGKFIADCPAVTALVTGASRQEALDLMKVAITRADVKNRQIVEIVDLEVEV